MSTQENTNGERMNVVEGDVRSRSTVKRHRETQERYRERQRATERHHEADTRHRRRQRERSNEDTERVVEQRRDHEADTRRRRRERERSNQDTERVVRRHYETHTRCRRREESQTETERNQRERNETFFDQRDIAITRMRRNQVASDFYRAFRIGNANEETHYLGLMDEECPHCHALYFASETKRRCCVEGRGSFMNMKPLPTFLLNALTNVEFRNLVRHYNTTFQIAILGSTDIGRFYVHHQYPFYVKVCGTLYHAIPPIIAKKNQMPRFVQIYILDSEEEQLRARLEGTSQLQLDENIVRQIQSYLLENNPYVRIFHTMGRRFIEDETIKEFEIGYVQGRVAEGQLTGFVSGEGSDTYRQRLILVQNQNGRFTSISELNEMYDPLHYVLMFPQGEHGYSIASTETQTTLRFYQQLIQVRRNDQHPLHRFGRLFHEYLVDQWSKIESERLRYIQTHQRELRASTYREIVDFMHRYDINMLAGREAANIRDIGHSITILPATFRGGPRWYRSWYMDAINLTSQTGAASYFLTFTTNIKWKEIQENLQLGETANDRPDLVVRVFHEKFKEFIKDIKRKHVLGKCIGLIFAVEFQESGLPHGHVLVILDYNDRPRCANDWDTFIRATIPDRENDEELYRIITSFNLHGPCEGHRCSKETGKCHYHYPFPFRNETIIHPNGTVELKRPDNNRFFIGRKNLRFTNRDVVPYCPAMSRKYNCHICTLPCTTKMASIRYLFGYVLKGEGAATVKLHQKELQEQHHLEKTNEVALYLSGRSFSAPEAFWRMSENELVGIDPATEKLPVHLPNQQSVLLNITNETIDAELRTIANDTRPSQERTRPSKLEAFFLLNKEREHEIRQQQQGQANNTRIPNLLYANVSKYYRWEDISCRWQRRQRTSPALGGIRLNRLVMASIQEGERYYLRTLLQKVPNPTSFEYLKTYEDTIYNTFQEACAARGFLEDDEQLRATLQEISSCLTPATVRRTFAFLLAYAIPSEPRALYEEFIEEMAEDYMREHNLTECTTEVQLCVLNDIDQCLRECDRSLKDYAMLPQIPFGWKKNTMPNESKDSLIIDYYSTEERKNFQNKFENNYDLAWPEQRNIIDYVKRAIDQKNPVYALVDASAGTGKTFIIETLQNYLNSCFGTNAIYISVSSTGISADLLQYGRTAHYTFALPTNVTDLSTIRSQLEFESNRAERFRQATVLFWDEIFTIPRQYIEATDILFQQLKKDMRPFGGLIVLVSGDRKQTLAKIPHGYRAQIVQASFINSRLRSHFTTFTLEKNHRLTAAFPEFAELLEQIGTGTYPTTPNNTDNVILPDYLHRCHSMESLIHEIYGISTADISAQELACRAILTPLNRNVRRLNEHILTNKVPGEIHEFEANDTELNSENEPIEDVPPEILARLEYPGLPLHTLRIKTGCIVMCLRNLNTKLKNGTKLEILQVGNHYIKTKILTGSGIDQIETIPRICLTQTLQNETCTLRRRQFPLTLGYAMTADKSQGQGLAYVGLYLCTDFFAHGQLYTAMSRAKDPTTFAYYIETDRHAPTTKNIVWPEVFN